MTILKRFHTQILLFVVMINNQIATYWIGDKTRVTNWNGSEGYSNQYHYWLTFDHYGGIFCYLLLPGFMAIYPQKGKYLSFALWSIVFYASITAFEYCMYRYYGKNTPNEYLYILYLGAFLVGLMLLALICKIYE